MKTKNGFWILLSMMLFIGFVSCSDDDKDDDGNGNGNSSSIVGTWGLVHWKGHIKEDGQTSTWDEDTYYEGEEELEWIFKSNGTATFWLDDEKFIAEYTYKNNKLYMGEGDEIVFNVLKLNSEEMGLDLTIKDSGDELYAKFTFEKVD